MKVDLNTSFASIRDLFLVLIMKQWERQCRSQNSRAGPCTVVLTIFHICYISSSYPFHWVLKSLAAATAYLNRLTFLSLFTCHPSSFFSPSLSRPTSLPPSSLLTISRRYYPSALCTRHQKGSPFPQNRASRRAGEASLCACLRGDMQI